MPASLQVLLVFFLLGGINACAEFKSAGTTIGHASKDAAIEIGEGTERVIKEITAE